MDTQLFLGWSVLHILWVLFCFMLFHSQKPCSHALTHGIEDTDALDVVRYYYLFGSSNVRIQHNQWRYLLGSLREPQKDHCRKRICRKRYIGERTLWIPLSHHICLMYKQPGTHLTGGHWKVPPFYTTMKRGRLGQGKWEGYDWSLSKGRLVGKLG